jgi:RNase P/RNase MRP subunit p30
VPSDASLAQYANFFRVGHNASEFIVDFCQSYKEDEGEPKGQRIVARIIVTPEGARELHALLGGSLEQHGHLVENSA